MLKSSLLTLCLIGMSSSTALYAKKTAPPRSSYKKRGYQAPRPTPEKGYTGTAPAPTPTSPGDDGGSTTPAPTTAAPAPDNSCSPKQLQTVADWRAEDANLKQCREAAMDAQMSTTPQGDDLIFNAETCQIESCYKHIHELATKYAPDCTIGKKNAKKEAQNALKQCTGIANANGINTNGDKEEFSQAGRPSPLLTTVTSVITLVATLFL